jgi:hypothetical protein
MCTPIQRPMRPSRFSLMVSGLMFGWMNATAIQDPTRVQMPTRRRRCARTRVEVVVVVGDWMVVMA